MCLVTIVWIWSSKRFSRFLQKVYCYPLVKYFHAVSVFREIDAVLRFLKEQCKAKHIGAVGFCWGGAATHYLALKYPEIKAAVSVYGVCVCVCIEFVQS